MKRRSIILSSIIFILPLLSHGLADETAHWGYTGQKGPHNWGKLDPKYSLCSEGKTQIDKFASIMHGPNNRPVQTTNARVILK